MFAVVLRSVKRRCAVLQQPPRARQHALSSDPGTGTFLAYCLRAHTDTCTVCSMNTRTCSHVYMNMDNTRMMQLLRSIGARCSKGSSSVGAAARRLWWEAAAAARVLASQSCCSAHAGSRAQHLLVSLPTWH